MTRKLEIIQTHQTIGLYAEDRKPAAAECWIRSISKTNFYARCYA